MPIAEDLKAYSERQDLVLLRVQKSTNDFRKAEMVLLECVPFAWGQLMLITIITAGADLGKD